MSNETHPMKDGAYAFSGERQFRIAEGWPMIESMHVYKCNGFEPVYATCAENAALRFAQAKAHEIYGADARVEHISLEEFSPDGRIERYTANLCRRGECRLVWLCVTRVGRVAEYPPFEKSSVWGL